MKRRITSVLLAAMMFVVCFGVMAYADSAPYFPNEMKSIYTGSLTMNVSLGGVKNVKAVSKLKSSNPKVVSVSAVNNNGVVCIAFEYNKAGSAKVSFSLKHKGKTYKYTTNVKLIKYVNPFKSVKLGNKDLTKAFDKGHECRYNLPKAGKQKISVKVKKGWSITHLDTYRSGSGNVDIKNNSKVNLSKDVTIGIYVMNPDGYDCWCPISCY